MSAAVILAEGVEKWFGAAHVLKGCSLSVSRGEVVVIENKFGIKITEMIGR